MSKRMDESVINEWASDVHALAVEKNWWVDEVMYEGTAEEKETALGLDRDKVKAVVPTKLFMIAGEAHEAGEAARADEWATYWDLGAGFGLITTTRIDRLLDDAYGLRDGLPLGNLLIYLRLQDEVPKPVLRMPRNELRALIIRTICQRYKPDGFGIEVADGIIRSLDLLVALGYDVAELMEMKHTYNKTRKPRHGGKRF